MYRSKWNIGLEILNEGFRAVALQKKRYGWQLRQWWQQKFSSSIFNSHGLQQTDILAQALQSWRASLPKHISLRIAFPIHWVLQRTVMLPEVTLTEQTLPWYVESTLNKHFPIPSQELVTDYHLEQSNESESRLYITAAHRSELTLWMNTLKRAALIPEIIDIAPCLLRAIARQNGLTENHLLLHKTDSLWIVVAPLSHTFYFETISEQNLSLSDYFNIARNRYQMATQHKITAIKVSGIKELNELPEHSYYWNPFSFITQISPPWPVTPSYFTIACALAMRGNDRC